MKAATFQEHLARHLPGLVIPDEIPAAPDSAMSRPAGVGGWRIGNRWTVHPMEGWDGKADGNPTELTARRWQHFGASGAKLIWGGEAVAVRHDGRANPWQLLMAEHTLGGLERLRGEVVAAHKKWCGSTDGLRIGLQLTHSGRFAKPNDNTVPEPRVVYRHPILDARAGVTSDAAVLADGEVEQLRDDFIRAAVRARDCGYDFVDIKNCHGYLLHEFLSGFTREGTYGGDFVNRTRLLCEIIDGVRQAAPGFPIGIRLGIFDSVPFRPAPETGMGTPEDTTALRPYRYGFGVDPENPTEPDLTEGCQLLQLLAERGIRLINVTGGSPYYNPHMQRPAIYPPSDGYQPPEDPLAGVARHLRIVRELKQRFPELFLVGSAFSYLQEYIPHVAEAVVRDGWMDSVGLGRVMLSYWDLPADTLAGRPLARRRLCRTFSDCTTAPRNSLVSGCYPLDPHYKALPQAAELRERKKQL